MSMIPVAGPLIEQDDIEAVNLAMQNDWYQNAGQSVLAFEKAFADHVRRKYAVALPSCTSGIHLSLVASGVTSGDDVIVPNLTWIATSAPVSYVDAHPVFADVDDKIWCLSASGLQSSLTPNTKTAIVVDLYGNMPDWDALDLIAKKHNIMYNIKSENTFLLNKLENVTSH